MTKQLSWLILWGIVFGYMEAAVVVYLREIYYPEGFVFPVKLITGYVMWTEIGREAATLIIMWATVALAYTRLQSRIAAFFVLFGVWDIFYYVFLKLILNWPESLATWDILFLIPAPWVGPVWAPVLVSVGFIAAGIAVLARNAQGRSLVFGRGLITAEVVAALLIILSFLIPGKCIIEEIAPDYFPWWIFAAGFLLGIGAFLSAWRASH